MLSRIDMNLLPGARRRTARRRGRRKSAVPSFEGLQDVIKGDPWVIPPVVIAVLAVVHLGFTFLTQGVTLDQLKGELQVQREDSVRFAGLIAVADSLEARRDTLERKAQVIREIDSDRFVWVHILDQLSESLPEYTWLSAVTEIPASGRGSGVEFRIDGFTGGTATLTRFMRNLEDSPFIQDVRLQSDQQIQQGERLVHGFVLLARYEVADSSAIITEPIILARK